MWMFVTTHRAVDQFVLRMASGSPRRSYWICLATLAVLAACSTLAPPARATSLGYSPTAASVEPAAVCPPPTANRAQCQAIIDPTSTIHASAVRTTPASSSSPGAEVSPACFIGESEYCGSGAAHGLSAQDLESAYKLPSATAGSGQTVAIVDAYDDPNAQADLDAYRANYHLPACESGCFTKVNQVGGSTYPEASAEWSLEISLDLDMVSASCPKCHILLVEANNPTLENLGIAENEAATLGATEISNSYVAREVIVGKASVEEGSKYFKHAGIPIAAASGDDAYNNENLELEECTNCSTSFPADLSSVIAVGGTTLETEGEAGRGWRESVWGDTGSGCTLFIAKPTWQTDKGCPNRTDNDVAAEASASTPVSVYDTYSLILPGWQVVGGTSVATPLTAGAIALESSAMRAEGSEGIYSHPSDWFDVSTGSNWTSLNGECAERYLCNGETGYDGPTGIGTPDGGATATPPSALPEPASAVTTTAATLNALVNPEASSTTYRFEYGTTTAYGSEAPVGGATVPGYTQAQSVSQTLAGLSANTAYHYRVVATSAGGTTYGPDRTFSTAPKVYLSAFGSKGTSEGDFEGAWGTATAANGDVWVSDYANDRIEEFSPTGRFIRECGAKGSGEGQFNGPTGITINPTNESRGGYIYVSDSGNNRIEVFSPTCKYSETFGTSGSENGQLSDPTGLAFGVSYVYETHIIAVADSGNNRIEMFKGTKHEFSAAYGSKGSGEGQFTDPTDVILAGPGTFSDSDDFYVVDSGNSRVQEFSETSAGEKEPRFKFLQKFGTKGTEAGELSSPTAIALDRTTGDLLVTDTGNNRVEEFLQTGAYVAKFGSVGAGSEEFESPKGIAVGASGSVDVADYTNDRVDIWQSAHSQEAFAETEPATSVGETGATLNGIVDPEGLETTYYFEYGSTTAYGSKTAEVNVGAGKGDLEESKALTGLAMGTTYHFRVVATNSKGTIDGADQSFSTIGKPTVETDAATGSGDSEAEPNGIVNPRGAETKYYFEYGPTTGYGSKTVERSAGAGTGDISAPGEHMALTGLTASTTYHFRIVATNSHGTTDGADQVFVTTDRPTAETSAATSVGETEGTLHGAVNPAGVESKYYFEYGPTTGYGSKTAEVSAGAGTSTVEESKAITGLTAGSVYHFRIVATNSHGRSEGADERLTTTGAAKPAVRTNAATSVFETESTLNGVVDPHGAETKYYFEYGLTTSYGSKTAEASAGAGIENVVVTKAIASLTVGATYHFRIVATNGKGTTYGSDEQFFTKAVPAVETKAATGVAKTEATLNGAVNPHGNTTKYVFEYGRTTGYGSKTAEVSAGSGTSSVEVNKTISGLEPEVTYHFRIVATNSVGTSDGSDRTFKTTSPTWRFTATPDPSETVGSYLRGVSCTAPAACTAVGDYIVKEKAGEKVLAERWNGKEWALQSMINPSGGESPYAAGVACSTATACMAVGYYENSSGVYFAFTESWNGTEWKIVSTPEPTGALNGLLSGVACTSSTACTAVGWYENSSGVEVPWADRWNGTAWSVETVPAPTEAKATYPLKVSCASATACTLVGYYENGSSAHVPLAESWNGSTWSVQSMPNPSGGSEIRMEGVSCTAATECTAVGFYENSTKKAKEAVAERWNGTEWAIQTLPEPSESKENYAGGVSCVSSKACTLAGVTDTSASKDVALAERWNGTEWEVETTPDNEKGEGGLIGGASCASLISCAAVGNSPQNTYAEIAE
jgi:NHL repeat